MINFISTVFGDVAPVHVVYRNIKRRFYLLEAEGNVYCTVFD